MPITKPKVPAASIRHPPPTKTEPTTVSKKKKKKKGKGKLQDPSNPVQPVYHGDQYGVDDDEDDITGVNGLENEHGRRDVDSELDSTHYSISATTPLNAVAQASLRMSSTTPKADLLAAANELYRRIENEHMANENDGGEYWKQLPSHIRSFVETTYAQGASLTPSERSKSQAMLALAQTMVDEATSHFQAPGGFPPPFDPSLLSDPKFAEKLAMKHGAINIMQQYDDAYEDYISENEDDDIDDSQQYEVEDSAKKKKKKKKKNNMTSVVAPEPSPLPAIIPSAPNPAPIVTRAAPSVAQPRPSSRAAGKQPVYNQPTVPPVRTNRSSSTKSPVPYSHVYPKSTVTNGNSSLAKRPSGTGGSGSQKDGRSKLWSNSTEEERERIKEFWLGLSETERRDLVKLEKEAVLKKMKEQQKHSCSCAVCGRKRNAIEEELEVLYDAYYEELELYANHQRQYKTGGKATPPPGPGPFPGSVAIDKNGVLIGGPPGMTKHPTRGGRPTVNGTRNRKAAPDSDEYDEDDYDDDEDEYDDEDDEDEDDEDDEDTDSNRRKMVGRGRNPPSRRTIPQRTGRDDLFNFGNLTAAAPGNILTVADDLLKNDGGKFLEMMEQLAERRMQRDDEAAREVEMDSDDLEDEPDLSDEDEEEEEEGDDDESEEEEEEDMSEEQKMEEGRKMFSIFAARMFEQRVLTAYREKVAAERQEQLLRELEDEDKIQAERDAKRQKENQRKKDKKKQQKQAKEAEKARKDAERAAEEASIRAKVEAHEEEMKRRRDEERSKREIERKQKEEEKARLAEERRLRIAEQKAIEVERKREKEERERKERLARQEREAHVKAERERKAKEAREVKEREEKEKREKEERERKDRERQEHLKAEEKKKQEVQAAAAKAKAGNNNGPTVSPKDVNSQANTSSQQAKKPATVAPPRTNGPAPVQRPVPTNTTRPPQLPQQLPQPVPTASQRPMMTPQGPLPLNMQLPPNMALPPMGMAPYNPVSPIALSPRGAPFGATVTTVTGQGPFSSLGPFSPINSQPIMSNALNGPLVGVPFPYDAQSPIMSPPGLAIPAARPPSTVMSIPSKVPGAVNGAPSMGPPPPAPNVGTSHIRRSSSQANPSPFGTIGKPSMSRTGLPSGPTSLADDEERSSVNPTVPSPPSPGQVLGSSALVDENDTIVELPKRRGTASWVDGIGTAAVGSRWGRGPTGSWPAPSNNTPPVGVPWSAAPGRPQAGRIDSPYLPS
ncbi:hypothetical protein FRC17_000028 [Serendipita sp. 399]|nr:hypothetical protein FRC17_000028 [Serendipita sp. 399]